MNESVVDIARVRAAVHQRQQQISLDDLKEKEQRIAGARPVLDTLRRSRSTVHVIAEVKRATATFADISGVGDPGMLARFYESGGAVAVSVVTECTRYRGSLTDLDAVRSAVDAPVLVNDMIVTPYQVHEARAHGADLILLKVRALPHIALESLIERTHSLGMVAVVEARTTGEAMIAVDSGAQIIAVDARDPVTFDIERNLFERVAQCLPPSVVSVAEGGVRGPHDVMDYARAGADVVIVGEAVVRSADPHQFVAELVAAGAHPALCQSARSRHGR
ncbi:indole-3-glycerol phosphate synthase TrpC [Actinomyces vulturis]|uniref:indole-3-glycerol phosphate synthase TrpC n=1 Tax=Actinomyces vulturis TaxID=1857645 RepID=UPI00082E2C58|nr:indole-3-glycerol phosphate synthase TrpC [Actinomyces vulturis]